MLTRRIWSSTMPRAMLFSQCTSSATWRRTGAAFPSYPLPLSMVALCTVQRGCSTSSPGSSGGSGSTSKKTSGNRPRSTAELLGLILGAAVFPISVVLLTKLDNYLRPPPSLHESFTKTNKNEGLAPDFTTGGGNGVAGGKDAVQMTHRPQLGGPFQMTRASDKKLIQESELFLGHWTLLYFGFANCAEICPNTLSFIRDVMKASDEQYAAVSSSVSPATNTAKEDLALPLAAQTLQACFLSVDYRRDNPKVVSSFLKPFNNSLTAFPKIQTVVEPSQRKQDAKRVRIEGLSGTREQVELAARSWRVYFSSYDESEEEKKAREAKGVAAPDPMDKSYQLDHSSAIYLVGPDGKMKDFFFREIGVKDTVERLGLHFQNVYGIND